MSYFIKLVLLVWVFIASSWASNVETFAKEAKYKALKISPDGQYLAAKMNHDNKDILVVIERSKMKLVHTYQFGEKGHVGDFFWVNDDRLVFDKVQMRGWHENPVTYGEIYAGNADGSEQKVIFGFSAGSKKEYGSLRTRNLKSDLAFGEIVDLKRSSDDEIIIAYRPWGTDIDTSTTIANLNVYTGKKSIITRLPVGNMNVKVNELGEPLYAVGVDDDGYLKEFVYNKQSWRPFRTESTISTIVTATVSNKSTLTYLAYHSDKLSVFQLQFPKLTNQMLFSHEKYDVEDLITDPVSGQVVGASLLSGYPEYHYFEPEHRFAKLHSTITSVLPQYYNQIVSATKDNRLYIVQSQSDQQPTRYFLFDTESNKLTSLVHSKPWIQAAKMGNRKPVEFTARDGSTVYAVVTEPPTKQDEVKVVTLVHGGPFGVYDDWLFDTEAQMLASHGFTVLQINYRGSGGYGEQYEDAGIRKLSTLMQYDIVDGTKWYLKEVKLKDESKQSIKANACIMGWSFGGYSAVMSSIQAPDVFRCAVTAAGYYDAYRLSSTADYTSIDSVNAVAQGLYGDDKSELLKASPVSYLNDLNVPVLIAHGGQDKRIPVEQAHLLKDKLEALNKPYDWFYREKEGHGFYNEKNRVAFYSKVIEFLSQHL